MPINKLQLITPGTTLTSAGAQSGVSVSNITGDFTVKIYVSALLANMRVAVEETVNSFSTVGQLWVQNLQGPVPIEGVLLSFAGRRESAGTTVVGEANSQLRVNVQELNSYVPSVTLSAWVEY